jgi:ketosteroid isomerase-like protein
MVRSSALLSAVAFLGAACAGAPATDDAADRASIAAVTTATEAAENAGSVEQMRPHFAENLIMLGPDMPAVAGPEAVAQAMQEFFDAYSAEIKYSSEEIVAVGDWGFDRGTYRQTLTPKGGGAAITDTGKYLWIYRRGSDGSWKQSRVMWNSSEPAQSAR